MRLNQIVEEIHFGKLWKNNTGKNCGIEPRRLNNIEKKNSDK